jgi:hypothetical protein
MPLATTESHVGSIDLDEEHVLGGVAILDVTEIIRNVFWSLHKLVQVGVPAPLHDFGQGFEVSLISESTE